MLSRAILKPMRVPALRVYSTAQSPPLLLKLRTDLKDAMRNKDTNKLNVIRGILSDISNASKTTNPPSTDFDILSLINKTKTKSTASIAEFREAGREDLVEKETGQVIILDTYAGMVEKVGEEEITAVVNGVIEALKEAGERVNTGSIMKKALAELAGKPVVKAEVATIVKEAIEATSGDTAPKFVPP
ncbi:Yqey-like protein-domain-containing protein [Tuber borchii]|uniref:Altered inheritance of mitochondria protein 41 n=1 Tax=Tuber borchii TaxID=42251 RepID=A0A2T7A0L3_TUBBO|nr:Yqey-like protein-domain-containing protein [Tuber borchii]